MIPFDIPGLIAMALTEQAMLASLLRGSPSFPYLLSQPWRSGAQALEACSARRSCVMASAMKPAYVEAVQRIERLHRRLLDLVKVEFDRMGWDDITPAQALMMFHMGGEEMTAGELISRGCYSGTNVSYNLKQLVAGGYLTQHQATGDRRQQRVKLTGKGEEVAEVIDEMFSAHLENQPPAIEQIGTAFAELDRFWAIQANMIGRRA